jgi:hypothetical protein
MTFNFLKQRDLTILGTPESDVMTTRVVIRYYWNGERCTADQARVWLDREACMGSGYDPQDIQSMWANRASSEEARDELNNASSYCLEMIVTELDDAA